MLRLQFFLTAFSVTAMFYLPTDASAQMVPSEKRITIEQLIDIKHPSSPVWSPDGRQSRFYLGPSRSQQHLCLRSGWPRPACRGHDLF